MSKNLAEKQEKRIKAQQLKLKILSLTLTKIELDKRINNMDMARLETNEKILEARYDLLQMAFDKETEEI